MTPASQQALAVLRSTDNFQWYVVPLLALVMYAYINEAEKKNWNAVLCGLLLWISEFTWEIFNALILHFTRYAGMWITPGKSAYVILAGLNVEIWFMFALAGMVVAKSLPKDRAKKILGLPNRVLVPLLWGAICTFIEVLLNQVGVLVWDFWWWRWPHVYLLYIGYTLPFFLMTWAHDYLSTRSKTIILLSWVAFNIVLWLVLVVWLGWI
ncbi:MAG TPA: hypothetical protein PKW95_00340 [bacterium]|nr:hypothetical protein [bacterium]